MYLVSEMYIVITDTHSKTYKEALGLSSSDFVKPNLLFIFSLVPQTLWCSVQKRFFCKEIYQFPSFPNSVVVTGGRFL